MPDHPTVDFNDAAADAGYQTPVVYKFWAMTFFQAPRELHMSIAKHLTAEVKSEELVPGNGVVVKWTCPRRQNHFFDALYYAAVAGWYCGIRLPDEKQPPVTKQTVPLDELARRAMRPDGRLWIDNQQ